MTDKEIIELVAEKVTEAYSRGVMDGVKIANSYRDALVKANIKYPDTPVPKYPDISAPQEPLTISVYAAPAYPRYNTITTAQTEVET